MTRQVSVREIEVAAMIAMFVLPENIVNLAQHAHGPALRSILDDALPHVSFDIMVTRKFTAESEEVHGHFVDACYTYSKANSRTFTDLLSVHRKDPTHMLRVLRDNGFEV